jgi:hypothetical protein
MTLTSYGAHILVGAGLKPAPTSNYTYDVVSP